MSSNPPREMLAANQATLAVSGLAVAVVGGLVEDACAETLSPLPDPAVRNVGPEQKVAIHKIHGALAPQHVAVKPFDQARTDNYFAESLIDDFRISNHFRIF